LLRCFALAALACVLDRLQACKIWLFLLVLVLVLIVFFVGFFAACLRVFLR